jgi:hypothetical protein
VGEPRFASQKRPKSTAQLNLFAIQADPILSELIKIDVENITPEEALEKLKEIKKKLL